jgi:excinuclease ABC subunit C
MNLQNKTKQLPESPGVYFFKNKEGNILYIGKAKNLKKRVNSYALREKDIKIENLLKHADSLDYIVTDTEKEALILENLQIKKHKPKYNVIFKDDKNYVNIKVNINNRFPGIEIVRRRINDGSLYFGPYASKKNLETTLHEVYKTFKLRDCVDTFFKNRMRPCINYEIGKCSGPCCGLISEEDYRKSVNEAILFLQGKTKELLNSLKKQMKNLSENLKFEEAKKIRNKILAIEKTIEQQKIYFDKPLDIDVLGTYGNDSKTSFSLLNFQKGVLVDTKNYFVEEFLSGDLLESFIIQHYMNADFIPDEIIVDSQLFFSSSIEEILTNKKTKNVKLINPKKGIKLELLNLAKENAHEKFNEKEQKFKNKIEVLKNLHLTFNLKNFPTTIECFDISNLSGDDACGSCVCFKDGEKYTNRFRRYKIRLFKTQDDYGMLREVLTRRIKYKNFPDLILIDGGLGQLNIAKNVLEKENIKNIDLLSIAKQENTPDYFYTVNRKNPKRLISSDPVYKLLVNIRDAAHNFAISYNKVLRKKRLFKVR